MRRMLRTNTGFSLIELMVVVVIVGVILPIFAVILTSTYREAYLSDYRLGTISQARNALWFMDDDVKLATAFLTTTPSGFTDAYGARNLGSSGAQAWSYKGNSVTSRVLITRNFATSENSGSLGRTPVYTDGGTFNCTTEVTYQTELAYVTIYFVKDSTLYRRILTDNTTPLCPGNVQSQLQSCPPYITSGRDSSCKANDEVLATNVSKFDIAYFQISDLLTDVPIDADYTSTNPAILETADYVTITIAIASNNNTYTTTMTQRITRINHS